MTDPGERGHPSSQSSCEGRRPLERSSNAAVEGVAVRVGVNTSRDVASIIPVVQVQKSLVLLFWRGERYLSVERVRVQVMLNVTWYVSVGDFSVGRVILETGEVAGQRVVDEGRVLRSDNVSIIVNLVI